MAQTRQKIRRIYRLLALNTFNVLVGLGVINLLLGGAYLINDQVRESSPPRDARVSDYRKRFADLDAYTRIPRETANQYLQEQDAMGTVGFLYEPWVQFRNPEFHSALLNADSRGFRRTKAPRLVTADARKAYVFGGSTTFGYGVPDEDTIPSYLQSTLDETYPTEPMVVKNFGQGFYYSSQEMLLFLSLIKSGDVPDFAVFIDGGNDTSQLAPQRDEPVFTPTLSQLWNERRGTPKASFQSVWRWIPMVRLATSLSYRIFPAKTQSSDTPQHRPIKSDNGFTEDEKHAMTEYVVARYTTNIRLIRAICKDYEIQCLFVWQPHPGYKYDRKLHRTFPFDGAVPSYWDGVYSRMKSYEGDHFLYLGDMLEGTSEKVFVDDVHYNEATNKRIASKIAERLDVDGKKPKDGRSSNLTKE